VASDNRGAFQKAARDRLADLAADSRGVEPRDHAFLYGIGDTVVRVSQRGGRERQVPKAHRFELCEHEADDLVAVSEVMVK